MFGLCRRNTRAILCLHGVYLVLIVTLHFSAARAKDASIRTVESMRQLSAQLAEAERVALDAERIARLGDGSGMGTMSPHQHGMLTDTHGRHHNYLRISLTERYVFGSDNLFFSTTCRVCHTNYTSMRTSTVTPEMMKKSSEPGRYKCWQPLLSRARIIALASLSATSVLGDVRFCSYGGTSRFCVRTQKSRG